MKKDGKYRFSLQFGIETQEQIQAGELLERLGNRKSQIIVVALNEYMHSHLELQDTHCKIEVKLTSASKYNRTDIEQLVKSLVEEKLASTQASNIMQEGGDDEQSSTCDENIAVMLDNVNIFDN